MYFSRYLKFKNLHILSNLALCITRQDFVAENYKRQNSQLMDILTTSNKLFNI